MKLSAIVLLISAFVVSNQAAPSPDEPSDDPALKEFFESLPAEMQTEIKNCKEKFPKDANGDCSPCGVKCFFQAVKLVDANMKLDIAGLKSGAEKYGKMVADKIKMVQAGMDTCYAEAGFDSADPNDAECKVWGKFLQCGKKMKKMP